MMNAALLPLLWAATCPANAPAPGADGMEAVARLPSAEAMRLNGEGKQLYRQERWGEARAKYQAALAADGTLLGAQLNLACAYSREGLYAKAAEQSASLIRKSFVPWDREVREAADLGILQSQPEYAVVRRAHVEAARAWAKTLHEGVLFVARTRPPVRVTGEGTLVLRLHQEIFAWLPETGRYLQVTSEDGRVLAFVQSPDKRRVAYLLAGKLVRQGGQPDYMRELALRVLDLTTMELSDAVPVPDQGRSFALWYSAAPIIEAKGRSGSTSSYRLADGKLVPGDRPGAHTTLRPTVLSTTGVAPSSWHSDRKGCAFTLSMRKDAGGVWRIEVARRARRPTPLDTRYGAGLGGMPFPTAAPTRERTTAARPRKE